MSTRRTVIHHAQLKDLTVGTILKDRNNSAVWRTPMRGWCAANGAHDIDTQVLIEDGAPLVILWKPNDTNTDIPEASAVSQADQRSAEPTEAEITAAAESLHPGLFTLSDHRYGIEFDNPHEYRSIHQNEARDEARAALLAAREVARHE